MVRQACEGSLFQKEMKSRRVRSAAEALAGAGQGGSGEVPAAWAQ